MRFSDLYVYKVSFQVLEINWNYFRIWVAQPSKFVQHGNHCNNAATTARGYIMDFAIPQGNSDAFHRKVNFLAKRAEKCKTPFDMVRGADSAAPHPDKHRAKAGEVVVTEHYTIEAETPVIGGYSVVGTLDHRSVPGMVIVNSVPGDMVPREYHTCSSNVCDHCNKARNRKMSIVLRGPSGTCIVVGRSCVRDFIGYNVDVTLRYLEGLHALQAWVESDEFGGGYGCSDPAYSIASVVEQSAAIVRLEGYHNAQCDTPTSYKVDRIFNPPTFTGRDAAAKLRRYQEWCSKVAVTDADRELAASAIAWAEGITDADSSYLHNLQAIAQGGHVVRKTWGYTVSMVVAYQKHLKGEAFKAKKAKEDAEAADCPNGRFELTGVVLTIKLQQSMYGDTLKMLVKTPEGYKVWGSVPSSIDCDDLKGCTIRFTARVERSDNDAKFGYFTRPSKASIVEEVA